MTELKIIKVGGGIIEDDAKLAKFLDRVSSVSSRKIVVHGGGRTATQVSKSLGIPTTMVEGRRVTDADTLKVVTMVYGGLLNKNVVVGLQQRGCLSLGITGADLGVVLSDKRKVVDVDYGFVGDVSAVNSRMLSSLIEMGITPVCAPLSYDRCLGTLLNTNADTMAAEIAKAMSDMYDVSLEFYFEKPGVLSDPGDDGSVIPVITRTEYERYKSDGTISEGMIPKLDNAFKALDMGVKRVYISSTEVK